MIVAQQKPFAEIFESVKQVDKLLVLGCGSCVTVCLAGGEKEAGILGATLRLAKKRNALAGTIREKTIDRQCDREFFQSVQEDIAWADAVLSMACGVGVQFCGELFSGKTVVPALNTRFYGVTERAGVWSERCAGCGECVLAKFGGICPIARCSKSLLNGPCGGSQNGKCEVDQENIDCAWQLIHDRMKLLGTAHMLEEIEPMKDWSKARDGGPGKMIREDAML